MNRIADAEQLPDAVDGDADARKYVQRLLADGVDVPVDQSFDTCVLELPEWYDEVKFKRGQQYFHDNIFAMVTGKLIGLVSVLSIPSIIAILQTANGSTSPMKAYRRYMQTIFHMFTWYNDDLRPGTDSWNSLESVRKRHVRVTLHAQKAEAGCINQKDMALTQFAFCGFQLLRPHMVGLHVDADGYEGFVHFWRVLGHMQGIPEAYNLCTDSWATTEPRLRLVLEQIFRPHLERSTPDFVRMSTMLLDGFWCMNPLLHYGSFMYFMRALVGCRGYVYSATDVRMLQLDGADERRRAVERRTTEIGWWGRFNLWLHMQLHGQWMTYGWVRAYMNWHLRAAVWLIRNVPLLAIRQFGRRRAYVSI